MISDRCPACGLQGRRIKPITPRNLLTDAARARLNGSDGYRFCKNGACEIVYFNESNGTRFTTGDLKVPVFQKSTGDSRTVCYCFEHTVASIVDEVRLTGTSKIPDAIAEKCRQGLDRCEELNPQGACCLGNVKEVIRDSLGRDRAPSPGQPEDQTDCCSPRTKVPQIGEGGSGVAGEGHG